MKIRARKRRSLEREVPQGKSADSVSTPIRHSPFVTALQDAVDEREGDTLAYTFAAIDEAAETLRRSVTLRNLKEYKDLVRRFVRLLTAEAYAVRQEAGFDRYGHRRLYTIVTRIDAELESLTREVIKAQADNIDLVSRLDEIRGLLLDIYS